MWLKKINKWHDRLKEVKKELNYSSVVTNDLSDDSIDTPMKQTNGNGKRKKKKNKMGI